MKAAAFFVGGGVSRHGWHCSCRYCSDSWSRFCELWTRIGEVPLTADGRPIDWAAAERAAERLLRVCKDSAYVAPEDGITQARYLRRAAECMSLVAGALKLRPIGGDS